MPCTVGAIPTCMRKARKQKECNTTMKRNGAHANKLFTPMHNTNKHMSCQGVKSYPHEAHLSGLQDALVPKLAHTSIHVLHQKFALWCHVS
jgi:hypothetical protein